MSARHAPGAGDRVRPMIAAYRLQLRPGFGFAEVAALLPYFARLGISHLYLSPVTEARRGSLHGYDVVDHNRLRGELGGEPAFQALLRAAVEHGLELILDIVPNHADAGAENGRWQDVLAYGPYSPFASFFDVEWQALKPELRGKILLPFLGRPYGEALDAGEIRLVYEHERFFAAYHDHRFAISPATYPAILEAGSADAVREVTAAFARCEPGQREELEALRPRLSAALARTDVHALTAALSGESLHDLLDGQFWRLAYWKAAGYEINYRRFFYINDLVGLRVEDERVFADTHQLIARLVRHPAVAGVRVDHVDGLFDPHTYLRRLAALGPRGIWVEKILAPGETLPEAWPVDGTTGYEFLNDVLGVLTAPHGALALDRTYRQFVRDRPPYPAEAYRSKRRVMQGHLVAELDRLAYDVDRISEADYHTRDHAYEALREAIVEVIAALDRYRTYLPHEAENAEPVLRQAVYRARQRTPGADPAIYDFLLAVLRGNVPERLRASAALVTGRLQQYSAVVMAKGIEDTTFYRYVRLAALNEVGGDPARVGVPPEAFHARQRFRAMRYPRTLLATATHDHKHGEDLRMRMIVLAEQPAVWQGLLRALRPLLRHHAGPRPPAAGDLYLFAQTLAALWEGRADDLAGRLAGYMQKAAREAKLHTSWSTPDPEYEATLERFVRGVLTDPRLPRRLDPPGRLLAGYGLTNTISQLIVKLTSPGVPDFYQGSELLDLSLVDPDNRRPVDFVLRRRLCEEVTPLVERPDGTVLRGWLADLDARLKLYMMMRLLRVRRAHPDLFAGEYRPLPAEGPGAEHVLAYALDHGTAAVLVVVPRFPALLAARGGYASTRLPLPGVLAGARATEVLSGTPVPLTSALDPAGLPLPWAVLMIGLPQG